jgi:seryl-tRNA synthetase
MIDIRLIREQPERVRENIARRNDPAALTLFEEFLTVDTQWRALKGQSDALRSRRNKLSAEINEAKKSGKDVAAVLAEAKQIPQQLETLEAELKAIEEQHRGLHLRIPNLLHDSVPVGADDSENVPIRHWGEALKPRFALRPHGDIAEGLGSDFTRATKLSGAGFYFLKGDLALLNRALIQFAVDHLVKKGYIYTEPPLMMRRAPYEGVTSLDDFENVQYSVADEDLKLIATSEHPLVAQYMDEDIHPTQLPLKLAGYSMCFRKEIGSKGVDTKGLFRTHQFNKVEQVIICRPSEADALHEEIQRNGEELFEALGLPYRVVNVCTGDMGIVASKKYDTEVWMERQQAYKEVCSASNCTDYQARRLNIRYQEGGQVRYCYTLNNTAIATSRALVAILENYQQPDGSVLVPKVLQPYMGGKTVLKPAQ